MAQTMKPRSAARRSQGFGVVFAGADNNTDLAPGTPEIQTRSVANRFGLAPATAAALAELAYAVPESWRARA